MIEHIRGDMLEASAHILVNAVNCVGVMGAGVALAFKRHYPAMFLDYQRACRAGMVRPGRLHVWQSATGRLIVNLPTKRHWRDASRYEDVESGLDALHDFVRPLGPTTIALPALGCGHGGLDWARVSPIIHRKLGDLEAHTLAECPGGYGYLYITVRSRADTVFAFADDVAARVADTLFRRLGRSDDLRVGHGYTSTPYSRPPSRRSTGDVGASQTPPSIAP
ncbi:ADP-ribose 1-phosphate phophatase related protein [Sphingobium sp. TKS]|nr:ADP-ribose 1-phosphate phophatase related protein [Sphingobium sp. TKS]